MNRSLVMVSMIAGLASACSSPAATASDNNDDIVVADGKEDNYYSSSAREYFISGTGTVTLEPEWATKPAADRLRHATALVQEKTLAISWFLNNYLTNKEDDDTNKDYGGVGALVRFASEDDSAPRAVPGSGSTTNYQFDYKVQAGGTPTLVKKIGSSTFTLAMGKPTNAELGQLEFDHEWYRNDPWSSWDPTKAKAADLENMSLKIVQQTRSTDSWLAYDRLLADGQITIGVHFGWDYWDRYDIKGSRNLYNFLIAQGFKSPVAAYEKLLRTSGPLTKTITANGKPIVVKISIFHPGNAAENIPGPDPDTDAGGKVLESDMRDTMAHREVVIFEGHSGPLYGFALANWRKTDEGDMDDSKIPTAVMPKTYQIVLANGCDTYDLGAAFWKNPAKADKQNLNVITSTDFSNAGTEASAERLLKAMFNQTSGKLVPVKVSDLTAGLDADQGASFTSMYGVHGVDANPHYDPLSDSSMLCETCTVDADCGADGNRCTKIKTGVKACTIGCIDDDGCPTGYSCTSIASSTSSKIKTQQCVPVGLTCK